MTSSSLNFKTSASAAHTFRRWIGAAVVALGSALISRGAETPADLVVVNAHVITGDAASNEASAVAIKDGRFVAVGADREVRKWIGEKTRVIDAGKKTVIPGLIETHVHPVNGSRTEVNQPFVQLHSIAEIQHWVRQMARKNPPGTWIQLPRVDATRIKERRIPNSAELTAAAPNHPAVFTWQYANRQVQVLNQAALRAANITKDTKSPGDGKINLDSKGELTGVIENSGGLVSKFLSGRTVSDAQHLDSLEKLLRHYNELGITSITERSPREANFHTFEELKTAGRLTVRVTTTVGLSSDGTVAGTEKAIRALKIKPRQGDDWVRVGPIKFSVDGGVLYGTAFMREPYGEKSFTLYGISDPDYRGDLRINPEKLKNIIGTGHRLGWQMSSHVTGDAGVDAVLDAIEAASAETPAAPLRYNLLHAYFPDKKTADRAARLGVCVDTQPAWYYKDADALAEVLGPRRLSNFIGVKTWRDSGVKVAINSDHMQGFDPNTSLNPYNPFLTMAVAITRKSESGQVFGPNERVSRQEALRMSTLDAAWLSFDEKNKGSIEVGKLGDLAIITDNFMTCPEDRIKDLRSLVTVVGGKVVYEKAPVR